jgi:hypothetical protein
MSRATLHYSCDQERALASLVPTKDSALRSIEDACTVSPVVGTVAVGRFQLGSPSASGGAINVVPVLSVLVTKTAPNTVRMNVNMANSVMMRLRMGPRFVSIQPPQLLKATSCAPFPFFAECRNKASVMFWNVQHVAGGIHRVTEGAVWRCADLSGIEDVYEAKRLYREHARHARDELRSSNDP